MSVHLVECYEVTCDWSGRYGQCETVHHHRSPWIENATRSARDAGWLFMPQLGYFMRDGEQVGSWYCPGHAQVYHAKRDVTTPEAQKPVQGLSDEARRLAEIAPKPLALTKCAQCYKPIIWTESHGYVHVGSGQGHLPQP